MAVRNDNTEEDYLDSLLKAVLNESAVDNDEKQNTESDDELLGNIEADLFARPDDIEAELKSSMQEIDLSADRDNGASGKKKEKKSHFWSRKKLSDIHAEEHTDKAPEADFPDDITSDMELTDDIPSDMNLDFPYDMESDAGSAENISPDEMPPDIGFPEDIEQPYAEAPDGMEDILNAEPETSEEEPPLEEDMQGLYDILGVSGMEAAGDSDAEEEELKRLEEKKVSKRKNKKEKKSKKKKGGLFRRKNKDDEPVEDDTGERFGRGLDAHLNADINSDINDSLGAGSGTEEPPSYDIGAGSGEDIPEDSFGADIGLEGLGDMFIGGDEGIPEPEPEPLTEPDENTMLMEGLDNGEFDEDDIMDRNGEPEGKEKKEKKKKGKKEKKKKEKKEKKKKEPKKKKEKKPKPPKEPDEVIHISKAFIIFSVSLIILIVVGLILGGNYKHYADKTDAALSYYLNKDYEAAYRELTGLDMNEDDQFFYDKLEVIMYVQRHYTSYKNLYELEKYDKALHTLLRGVKTYDKYKEKAIELDCFDDYNTVLGWITAALEEKYGITESQARELNLIESRYEYAEKVYELSDKAKEKVEEADGAADAGDTAG